MIYIYSSFIHGQYKYILESLKLNAEIQVSVVFEWVTDNDGKGMRSNDDERDIYSEWADKNKTNRQQQQLHNDGDV